MREPIHRPCSSLEVSHISVSKSSITLRCFNKSCVQKHVAKLQNFLQKWAITIKNRYKKVQIIRNDVKRDKFKTKFPFFESLYEIIRTALEAMEL